MSQHARCCIIAPVSRKIQDFEHLLVQQACSAHLIQEQVELGQLSRIEFQKLSQSRRMALESAWSRLNSGVQIHEMELVLVLVDLLCDPKGSELLHRDRGLDSIITGLLKHLPLQYSALLTFVKRRKFRALMKTVRHPYASATDIRKVRIALVGLLEELEDVLLNNEERLVEEIFGIHLTDLDSDELQKKEREEFMRIEQDLQFKREMDRVVEGMNALNRKLEPFLPKITGAIQHQLSLNERLALKSSSFRTAKYANNPSNESRMKNLVQSLPSQYSIPYPLDPKSPEVFVPVVGELLANFMDGRSEHEVRAALFDALEQIGTVDEQEEEFFDSRCMIDTANKAATYLHSPYRVNFKVNNLMGAKPFEFEIERASIEGI